MSIFIFIALCCLCAAACCDSSESFSILLSVQQKNCMNARFGYMFYSHGMQFRRQVMSAYMFRWGAVLIVWRPE